MPSTLERPRTLAVNFDAAFRYFVPSRSRPKDPPWLVELDSYSGNGSCKCEWFQFTLEAILKKGISPRRALKTGLVELHDGQHIEDVLRCDHIMTARSQFLDDLLARVAEQRRDEIKREAWHA